MTLPTGSPPQFNFEDLARGGSLRQFDDHAALLASTDAAEGAGSLWFARGLPYREAASDATDHDYTTAGGVKLYAPVFGDDASTGFFSNGANPVAKLEWYGRVALGDAGDHNLATDGNVTGGGWPQSFTALNPAGGTQVIEGWDYAEDQSLVFGTTSGRGTIGIASQTEGGDGAVYTLKAFHNNNRDAGQKGGAVYIDAIYNDAAAGDTITQEANLANLVGPVAAPTPYTETAGEILNILRLGAGSDAEIFGPSYAIGAFIHAIDNGAKAHCGLLFEHNALLRDDQPDTPGVANGLGFARAVQTAYNVGYSWLSRDPVSTPGTQAEVVKLTSLVVDPTVKWRTEWTDTAFVVGEDVDPDSNLFVVNYNGTAGTGVSVTPSVAGGSPKIAAIGTNANINLEIDGKGTGDVYTPLGTSLGVGTPTPEYALDVNGSLGFTPGASVDPVNNGDVVFEATDNNTITLKHRGSDGTVRDLGLPLDQVLSTAPQPFESRAELVTWWAANSASVLAGEVLADGSVEYLKMPAGHVLFGADPIADLPGLAPFGDWYADHFGARTHANVQAAVDAMSSYGGGVLNFFPGEYEIDGTTGGRGLLLKDYVRLKGASTMGTVLKNVSDEWNAVLSVQGVDGIGVSDLTIDGDWPTLAPHPSDAIRGEGIVFFNDTTNPLRSAVFERLYIKNCAHYGFGAQNVSHEGVLIDSIVFENTGGDALDIKSFTSPTTAGPDRATTVSNIWVKSFQQNTDHDDQAGLDIRGVVNVENVYIDDTWDLKAGQTRKTGIRFNSDVTAQNRIGGHKSTLHGAYVGSSKPDTSGNFTDELIVGIEVSADYVSVSGATVENQLVGYRVVSAGDTPNPRGVSIQGKAINCKSDTTVGVGVDVGSNCRDASVDVVAYECETGFNIRGLAHDVQGIAEGCDVGLRYNQTSKSNIEVVCSNCTTDVIEASGRYAEASNIANDGSAVIGPRRVFTDIVATVDDSGWTGADAVLGGVRFYKYDATGSNTGLWGTMEMRATGSTGGNFALWFSVNDAAGTMVDVLQIEDGRIRAKVPVELPNYTVSALPGGVSSGATAFVTDASSPTHGAVVVGGGSTRIPVYFDGTDWRVG